MARLLIVDDDADIRDALRDALVDEGHSVQLAANGREALDRVRAHRPDLVLLDVGLPMLSSDVAPATFLKDAGLDGIAVILMSAFRELPNIAKRVGTPYVLMKPFWLEETLALVSRALAERTPPRPERST